MLIAHLPAGYLTARAVGIRNGPQMGAALAGSVFPDFDMLWFHLVDHGAVHHHRYWVHIPGFWALAGLVSLPLLRGVGRRAGSVFLLAVLVHLVLDSIGGGILWLWPLSDHLYALVEVPATQSHWIWSFVLHWTFLAEIAVIGAALGLYWTDRRRA